MTPWCAVGGNFWFGDFVAFVQFLLRFRDVAARMSFLFFLPAAIFTGRDNNGEGLGIVGRRAVPNADRIHHHQKATVRGSEAAQ